MSAAAESEIWDAIAAQDRRPTPSADCEVCHGTGTDEAFQSPCDCARQLAPSTDWQRRLAGGEGAYDAATDRAHNPGDRLDGRTFGRSTSASSPHPDDVTALAPLAAWLKQQTWSDFAQSLADQFARTGRLSPRQIAAAAKMRDKCEARRAARGDDETESTSSTGPTTAPAEVEPGRYAVELDDDHGMRYFKVDRPTDGRWRGYTFVDEQASDDYWPVKDRTRRAAVLAAIAVDPHAALIRYGRTIGACGRCGRTLTDESSRAAGIGPECAKRIGA